MAGNLCSMPKAHVWLLVVARATNPCDERAVGESSKLTHALPGDMNGYVNPHNQERRTVSFGERSRHCAGSKAVQPADS